MRTFDPSESQIVFVGLDGRKLLFRLFFLCLARLNAEAIPAVVRELLTGFERFPRERQRRDRRMLRCFISEPEDIEAGFVARVERYDASVRREENQVYVCGKLSQSLRRVFILSLLPMLFAAAVRSPNPTPRQSFLTPKRAGPAKFASATQILLADLPFRRDHHEFQAALRDQTPERGPARLDIRLRGGAIQCEAATSLRFL
jgi:hypothetical protein